MTRVFYFVMRLIGGLRVEIESPVWGLGFGGRSIPQLSFLSILAGFFLIGIRKMSDRVHLFNLIDGGDEGVSEVCTPTCGVGFLRGFLLGGGLNGTLCPRET